MRKLLYITSASYSGSTLLTFLLAAHQDIATVGELKATAMGDIEQYRCSCGTLIRECAFWALVASEMRRRGMAFDVASFGTHFQSHSGNGFGGKLFTARVRGPLLEAARSMALRLPDFSSRLHEIVERNQALIDVVCGVRNAPVFLDGSKDAIRLKFLLEAGRWDLKVVHLTRDGRGACNSFMRINATSMEPAALEWRRTNEECERLARRMPAGSWLRLRYEDLCAEPAGALAAIYRLIGVEAPPPLSDFRSIDHHILGNAMRLRPNGRIQQDEKWRNTLSPGDLKSFEELAGALNRRYGYTAA
jgi:Sulfotransferase family